MDTQNQTSLFSTFANGKLLLTGEYAVLDGAAAIAVPTKYGQHLNVFKFPKHLLWESYTNEGDCWFSATFSLDDFSIIKKSDEETAIVLQKMLRNARLHNPGFGVDELGYLVQTKLDFQRNWGLGSSSTLVAALAKWAGVSPYPILKNSLGGSGYDLACAYAKGVIRFQLIKDSDTPSVEVLDFRPPFSDYLHFVFLEKKKNSRSGIKQFRCRSEQFPELSQQITILGAALLRSIDLDEFCHHLAVHERIIGAVIDEIPVQKRLFSDFKGQIKSLGAWGGDFVLAASHLSEKEVHRYFIGKGYSTVIPYKKMLIG